MQKISDLLYVRKNFLMNLIKKHNAPRTLSFPSHRLGTQLRFRFILFIQATKRVLCFNLHSQTGVWEREQKD